MTGPLEFEADPLSRAGQLGVDMGEFGAGEAEAEYGRRSRLSTRTARAQYLPPSFRPVAARPAPPLVRWPIRRGPRSGYPIVLPPWSEWRSVGAPANGISRAEPVEHVRWAQNCLNRALGLRLRVTGTMDAATRSAVRSFQKKHGLPVDGSVGAEMESALSAACAGTASMSASPSGGAAAAQELQFATGTRAGAMDPAAARHPCGCAGKSAKKIQPCSCHDKQRKPASRRRTRGAAEPWRVRNDW